MGNCIIARNGGGMETYSTEEQVIGTWVDGKKIYRKCLIANQTVSSGQKLTTIDLSYDKIIDIYGCCVNGTDSFRIPTTVENSWRYVAYINKNGTTINLSTVFSSTCSNVYIFVEYTKTTD